MSFLAGLDIGGTKCAVLLGKVRGDEIDVLKRVQFPTPLTPEESIAKLIETVESLMSELNVEAIEAIGVSCGGPLNSEKGLIISPPNLPNWKNIEICKILEDHFQVPVALQNDANAGALAEWRWGAGKGTENMIFLTFGTGMGAGLILNGQLYSGTNDLAGEVGHIRLADTGPIGFGKEGSFEGFCSGGGIARLAQKLAKEALARQETISFCSSIEEVDQITAKKVGIAAQQGDKLAIEVFEIVGKYLGRGLALLVDILNPQKIVIGSIYGRQKELLEPLTLAELEKEAISLSDEVCEISPAGLGESIGDYASFSVAYLALEKRKNR